MTIAYHLLRTARRRGVDIKELEARFEIWVDRPADVLRRLPLAQSYELWEELLRRSGDPQFPFEVATIPFPESVALFVFVTASRQTVRDALDVLITRSALITNAVRFELEVAARAARLHVIGAGSDRVGAHASVEFLVGHIVNNLRCATGNRCRPTRIQLAHPERGAPGPTTSLGPVELGGPASFVEFDVADLDLPLDVLDGLTQILASRVGPPDLISRVRNAITISLATGARTSIGSVARAVGLAPRTLQRQLPDGITFGGLVQAAQRDLALALVRARRDLPIKEIAARVGFASARAFSRAYRRWTGMPPVNSRGDVRASPVDR